MTIQHRWKTIQTGCQDPINNCLREEKISVIMGNKFRDFDNQLFNTGLTVIGILKNQLTVLKTNPSGLKPNRSFTCVVRFVT